MSHPASRLLGMLELLQAHRQLTTARLAADLQVDERTVRRYALTLADLGVPVTAVRGRYGGYRLGPGYKLPPLMLTDDEAVAVALGLVAADHIGLATQTPATASALAKIQRVLPVALGERLAGVISALGFTLKRRDSPVRPAASVLLTVGEAVRTRHRLHIGYRSWRGEDSSRELDAYGLVFHAGHWYVTGLDHASAEAGERSREPPGVRSAGERSHEPPGVRSVRTFRLDRISGLRLLADEFTAPAGFDAVAHVAESLARVPYAWRVEVLLETDLETARIRVPATVGELESVPGGVVLRTRAENLDGMAAMLAGLGWPFTVIAPQELKAEVAAYAERLTGWAAR